MLSSPRKVTPLFPEFKTNTRPWLRVLILMAIIGALYLSSLSNYLLFHVLVELFSVVIAFSIFILTWNAHRFLDNGYMRFMGIAFLFIGVIDLMHTLAYQNMGVFPGDTADMATQLWLAARYTQSLALLIAPLMIQRHVRPWPVLIGFGLFCGLLLLSIFTWKIFPTAFITGVGLTSFKIISEFVIIFILAASAALLYVNRRFFDASVWKYLLIFLGLTILAEFAFTTYANVFGFANAVGHLLKILAFYFVYKAILETGFVRPYAILFRSLAQREEELSRTNILLEEKVKERTQALSDEIQVRLVAEEALVLAKQELEARVAERTTELQQVNESLQRELSVRQRVEAAMEEYADRLEVSNRELEEFAFVASHDLQEPLRKIQTFGERLSDQLEGRISAEEQDYMERMLNAARRMRAMINDLLALSRVTSQGKDFISVNLEEAARDVLTDMEVTVENSGATVEVGPLPVVQADPLQMRQLLQNLLANALKFTRPDTPPLVKVSSEMQMTDSGPMVELRVQDNGIGFEQIYAERIFQPFQRLHGRGTYEGSGIGLAICRKIVERHGGSISAESVVGGGALFRVCLPARLGQPQIQDAVR